MRKTSLFRILLASVNGLMVILVCNNPANAQVIGFVVEGENGECFEYEYKSLFKSYVIHTEGVKAPLFLDYRGKTLRAYLDDTNGYIDYKDVVRAYAAAKTFDMHKYTSSKNAKKAKMPSALYLVTQDSGGKLKYTKKMLETTADVIAAMKGINTAASAAAMKTALLKYDDTLGLALNRYNLTTAEQDALAGRLLELKPFASPQELQRLLHVSVIALRFGYTITHPRYDYTMGWMVDKQMALTSCPPRTDLDGGWKNAKRVDVQRYVDPYNFIDMDYDSSSMESVRITADPRMFVRERPTTESKKLIDTNKNEIFAYKGEVYDILGEAKAEAGTQAGTEGTWYKIRASGKEGWVCGKYCAELLPIDSMLQFLLVSEKAGATVGDLNSYLSGKGIFNGLGQAFLDASINNDINELFFVFTALHESGNGNSTLAKGVEVKDEKNLFPGKETVTVYNMFGIGAYDSNPTYNGAMYAYNKGWFTPEKAIQGGAEFISNNYVNSLANKQNTLYKIRWNPNVPATHQYATDIGWASKIASRMWSSGFFKRDNIEPLTFEIPRYKE